MAVAKMELISIVGHVNALDAMVNACVKSGVFQPENTAALYPDLQEFLTVDGFNPYAAALAKLETALTRFRYPAGSVTEPTVLSDEDLFAYAEDFAGKLDGLNKRQTELAELYETQNQDIEQLEHFKGLDVELDAIIHCETIKVRFGRLPKESYEKLKFYDANPYVMFFPSKNDAGSEYYWGVYFVPLELSKQVDRIFSGLYFERMRVPDEVGTPEEILERLSAGRAESARQLREIRMEIQVFWESEKERCGKIYSRLRELDYNFKVRRYAVKYKDDYVMLAGWIPVRSKKAVCKALDGVAGIDYTLDKPEDTTAPPPVALRNPRLFKAFEFFVNMYGLPRYNELDPTFFVAVTYTLLFGIMFADVGQGLVVALAGWLLWRFKRMNIGRILIPCGLAAAVCGTVTGSVFGFETLLDPVYSTLFGWKQKPVEVMETKTVVGVIIAAVLLGILLVLVSILLNIYVSVKRRDYENAFFGPNGAAGFILLAAMTAGFGGGFIGWQLTGGLYNLLLIYIPLLLIFFREPLGRLAARKADWKPERWGEFVTQNFFELFEFMLSYLSNIVSFLRVSAFVLIHAGMMLAVFKIAGLFGPAGFAVTVIFGNLLVIGMEAVLVSIQVL
ncbi:MAG: ATPase, partial [Oscillospiraceae bacterium]|nr:ATPase [Oscillospiraceae bacterium]